MFDVRCSMFDLLMTCFSWRAAALAPPATFTKLRLFQHIGNSGFVDLDFHVVSYFQQHGPLLHIRNETVNAGVGYDPVAALQAGN